ncbi:MAG: carboxypeptidase-like regulatory domain-containing protein [candidate division KSB1 bacterium]|nr:carboxypeptidase-like regulatory domain-containing protein [candidate division KSB1 bacterium]MDZ7368972.1 carboxypeptidase-like regulatory domain-containing protein [candidate division KSB1 bacterium]MDZ7406990.1 carboxypeptidase-like regulatory domain-containing protein [candidate division KSB1 bacterium]
MKKFIVPAFFGFMLVAPPHESRGQVSQLTISGRIKDNASGLPLTNVNVFLANTTLGAVSDKDGFYAIRGVPVGTHELVASLLGYEVRKSSIRITDDDLRVDLSLTPKPLEMPQIDIIAAPDREWKRNLQKFEELFWGNAYRASECKILNPEVLDFSIEKDTGCFIATANQPLQIENRRLGYRAQFIVQEFRYYLNEQEIKYAFTPKFEEIEPAHAQEAKKWRENRIKAYHGSFRHFLTALLGARLKEEGFFVTDLPDLPWERKPGKPRFLRKSTDFSKLLSPGALPSEMEFNFQGCLEVVYTPEGGSNQISWMVTNRDHILVNKAGYAYDGYAFVLYGHWFLQRAAEMLPRDYVP